MQNIIRPGFTTNTGGGSMGPLSQSVSGLRDALAEHLATNAVIPAVKNVSDLDYAAECGAKLVFLVTGSVLDLHAVADRAAELGQSVFCHLDLMQGIGKDRTGVQWLARDFHMDGILTTRTNLVRYAKEEGLVAIQRLFLFDSGSLNSGLAAVAECKPDAVEILPGIVLPSVVHRLPVSRLPRFIGGGLIETPSEVQAVLKAGAVGVSASNRSVWKYGRV